MRRFAVTPLASQAQPFRSGARRGAGAVPGEVPDTPGDVRTPGRCHPGGARHLAGKYLAGRTPRMPWCRLRSSAGCGGAGCRLTVRWWCRGLRRQRPAGRKVEVRAQGRSARSPRRQVLPDAEVPETSAGPEVPGTSAGVRRDPRCRGPRRGPRREFGDLGGGSEVPRRRRPSEVPGTSGAGGPRRRWELGRAGRGGRGGLFHAARLGSAGAGRRRWGLGRAWRCPRGLDGGAG